MAPYYDTEAGRYVILAYALLISIDGAIAWFKSRSRVSLVSSVLSSTCLFVAFGISWAFPAIAFASGAIVAANLAINFALRVQATRKVFPSGLMLMLSLGVFVFLCILAARAPPTKGLPNSKAGGGGDKLVVRSTTAAAATPVPTAGSLRSGRRGLLRRRPPLLEPASSRPPPAVRETP